MENFYDRSDQTSRLTGNDAWSWRTAATWMRQNPLAALGVSAAIGFVIGGGARTRLGGAALLLTARTVFRETILGAVGGAIRGHDGAASNGSSRF